MSAQGGSHLPGPEHQAELRTVKTHRVWFAIIIVGLVLAIILMVVLL